MKIELEKAIIEQLSSKGILAYLAVRLADGTEATTAALASLVRCQTAVMREGLKELAVAAPGAVGKNKNKWICGLVKAGDGQVELQNLDSERFRSFVDDLKKYWDFVNDRAIPFAMDGRDGIQIRSFLSSHREWSQEDWLKSLRNRAISVIKFQHASKTEPLYVWVGKLASYWDSPLNEYGKPGRDNGKAGAIQNRNSEAAAAYLSGRGRV